MASSPRSAAPISHFSTGSGHAWGKTYALSEASYAVVSLLQAYPDLRIPPGIEVVPTGQEKRKLTLVVSGLEGCKVVLG